MVNSFTFKRNVHRYMNAGMHDHTCTNKLSSMTVLKTLSGIKILSFHEKLMDLFPKTV